MRAALVVAVVLLAGCSALSGGGGSDGVETVTPVPEVTPEERYPPGVSERGVTDAEFLASVHSDQLAERSFTLTSVRTVNGSDATTRSGLHIRVAYDGNDSYHAWAATAGPDGPVFLGEPPASAEFWSDGETYLRKLTRENETRYDRLRPGRQRVPGPRYWTRTAAFGDRGGSAIRTYQQVLSSFVFEVERGATVDGTPTYRLVSVDRTDDAFAPSEMTAVRNASAELTVTSRGFIRSAELRYEGTVDGERVVVDRRIEYERVGETTVGRPAWDDRALNQTSS